MNKMSNWFFRLAVLYFVAGVVLGLFMAASGDHSMFPVHAHLNLLGWVTLSLFGFYYRLLPAAASTRLAQVQFWIYVPAHFAQMVLLFTKFRNHPEVEPVLAVASTVVGVGVLCFAAVVWRHTKMAAA